jgi:hypothetical protein
MIGFAIVIRWNFLVYGSEYIIPILIMANSPQLEIKQVRTASKSENHRNIVIIHKEDKIIFV